MEEIYVISKDDMRDYFDNRKIISKEEYIEYLKLKYLNNEKVV